MFLQTGGQGELSIEQDFEDLFKTVRDGFVTRSSTILKSMQDTVSR